MARYALGDRLYVEEHDSGGSFFLLAACAEDKEQFKAQTRRPPRRPPRQPPRSRSRTTPDAKVTESLALRLILTAALL